MLICERKLNTETNEPTMVLDGLAQPTATETTATEVYWRWTDEPDMEFQFLGKTAPGSSLVVPFDLKGRSILLAQIGYTALGRPTDTDLKQAEYTIFEPPMARSSGLPLFNHYTDETTAGTTQENLYTYTLPANSMSVNGDKLRVEYGGEFTANTNTKRLFPKFAGTVLATGQVSATSATDWAIDYYLIRVSNSVVRYTVEFTAVGEPVVVESGEITGLDLTANAYDVDLDGRTVTTAGELTAKTGYGVFIPGS